MKEVDKSIEILGWYSNNADIKPMQNDLKFHRLFTTIAESVVYFCFDPKRKMVNEQDFPAKLYEMKVDKEKGERF